jgi:hypothetical protein
MKFFHFLLALPLSLIASLPADAATINIGSTTGTYDISSSGTESWGTVSDYFSGTLAADSSVTFSFTVSSTGANNGNKGVSGGGSYSFYEKNGAVSSNWLAGYNSYSGGTNAYDNPNKSGSSWGGYNDASNYNSYHTLFLMLSSANLAADGKSGTVTITNQSNATVSYWADFVSTVTGYSGQTITYTVSAVPLPPSLPLFSAALVGLGGLGWRKRKAVKAA